MEPGCFSLALATVLAIITFYSGMAAYRLKDDAATAASVTGSFWIFLVLLLCRILSVKEIRAAAGPARRWRDRLKAYICALATLLYFHLAYMSMGAAALTLRVALLVWFMPAAAWAGLLLYAFFCQDRVNQTPDGNEQLLPL